MEGPKPPKPKEEGLPEIRFPKFIEEITEKINLTKFFVVLTELMKKFPTINFGDALYKLTEAFKNKKGLLEEASDIIDQIHLLYFKFKLGTGEIATTLKERIIKFLKEANIDFDERGEINPEVAYLIFFLGLLILVALVVGFGIFGIGQVHKLKELEETFKRILETFKRILEK